MNWRSGCPLIVFLCCAGFAGATPVDVIAPRDASALQSLNGDWAFKYIASSEVGTDTSFFETAFDVSSWRTLPVPAHWEMHGFAEPKYGRTLAEGTGLYRRSFATPATSPGARVMLRFDGVLYGLQAWVNARPVGEWGSGYNAVTFDITDALTAASGATNTLAVRVSTRVKGWEFDTNDCWSLSGIYRDVTLFVVPPTRLADWTTETTLQPDGAAEVRVKVAVTRAPGENRAIAVAATLAGQSVTIPVQADGSGAGVVRVASPRLWTAETPELYPITLAVSAAAEVVQRVNDRVGLRQITIEGPVLKLNGRAIKLRGANHHDIWPDVGRAGTVADLRRDLELMRAANINFVRTAHYPPHAELSRLCDEMGFYVMCEVPFGFGDEHLNDPTYQDILLTRGRATVMRDKNSPSVIVWSIGNENPITDSGFATGRHVKDLDPSRPICIPQVGSYFGRNYQRIPDWVDIYAPHYPVASTLVRYATELKRPTIVTEYAHALGLATDRVESLWDVMAGNDVFAGGAIWMFQDQGILRTAAQRRDTPGTNYVWLDARHYYDTNELDGADGVVYSDRTPQTDFFQLRKVYSPVWINETELTVRPGRNTLALSVANRFDFRALSGMHLEWSWRENGAVRESGRVPLQAAARATETVNIPLELAAGLTSGVHVLALRCLAEDGESLFERSVRLNVSGAVPPLAALRPALTPAAVNVSESQPGHWTIAHRDFSLLVAPTEVRFVDPTGRFLASGPFVHVGRPLTMAEDLRSRTAAIWQGDITRPHHTVAGVARVGDTVEVKLRLATARAGESGQTVAGDCVLVVRPDGTVEVRYDLRPANATGNFLSAGVMFLAPVARFEWIGQGPFPGYPGKDRLNEFGVFSISPQERFFAGNRRGVEFALARAPGGGGIAFGGAAMDLELQPTAAHVEIRHNAILSGLGNKGVRPEVEIDAARVEKIVGEFTVLPLGAQVPAPISRWFAQDNRSDVPALPVFRHSYDQP